MDGERLAVGCPDPEKPCLILGSGPPRRRLCGHEDGVLRDGTPDTFREFYWRRNFPPTREKLVG